MTDLRKILAEATPGPWVYRELSIHGRKYGGGWVEGPETTDDDGKPCATLIQISGSGGSRSYTTRVVDIQDHNDNDANARLIALAPQLAAEVLRTRKLLDDVSDPDFLFGAMDNVNDMGVSLTDFANAASRAIRAAMEEK